MDIKALFIRSVFYIHDTRRTHNTSWAQTNTPAISINCSHMQTDVLSHQTCFDKCTVSLSNDLDVFPALSLPFTDIKRYTRGHPRMLAFCLEDLSTSSLVLPLNPSILLLSAAECRWFSFIYPSLPVPLCCSRILLLVFAFEWQQMNEWIKWII